MDEMGIEQARPNLGEIVDRARLAEDYTMITRQGKPAAIVISFRGFATLLRRIGLGEVDPATAEWQQIVAAVRKGRRIVGLEPQDERVVDAAMAASEDAEDAAEADASWDEPGEDTPWEQVRTEVEGER